MLEIKSHVKKKRIKPKNHYTSKHSTFILSFFLICFKRTYLGESLGPATQLLKERFL